jgi:hypothetical protein
MKFARSARIFARILPLALAASSYSAAPSGYVAPPPLASWEFAGPDSLRGWDVSPASVPLKLSHRRWTGKMAGATSVRLISPPLRIQPSPLQALEIRMRVDRDAELRIVPFGANSAPAAYAPLPFPLRKTRRIEEIRLLPFWQGLPALTRLGLDLTGAGSFEIERIRVIDLGSLPEPGTENPDEETGAIETLPPAPSPGPEWEFSRSAEGWSDASGLDDMEQWLGALFIRVPDEREGRILSPMLSLRAETHPWLTLRIKRASSNQKPRTLGFFWAREGTPGDSALEIPLKESRGFETYSIDLSKDPGWKGAIQAVGFRLPPDSTAELDFVRLGAAPRPDPEEASDAGAEKGRNEKDSRETEEKRIRSG